MSYITMKTDVQNALTQVNTAFGDSLTDRYDRDFKLPYAAFILPVSSEALKTDSYGKNYYNKAVQQLRIIIELEDRDEETETYQICFNTALELQDMLLGKYFINSEFITPLKSIHNKDKPCYESLLTITER